MSDPIVTLAPDVYRIGTLGNFINTFVFLEPDGSVSLVDCGLKKAPGAIVRGLTEIGKHPHDVRRIVLTHAHDDHMGGAAEMISAAGLKGAAMHEADAQFVRAGALPPRDRSSTSGRIFARIPDRPYAPFAVSEALSDGQLIDIAGGLRVIHTPGHTPGHISLLHESTRVLITGDSIFNMGSRLTWALSAFCT
ncbi:MAG: MBL fold metallo-hydrolase, partial [Candidatus Nanopelagicales bacterium]|nr:MBL fold metallo-hydrolase [Candidatus Nanopelagicales bacterium]